MGRPAPTSEPRPAIATVVTGAVFGRYVLVSRIGRGAMGEVWAAIDPDLDRKVALKLLRHDRLGRPEDRERLAAEARAMARLTHPNVVTVHDVGELGEQLFIAMEFVEGQTLERWIAAGPHPWAEVLEIMRQAAAGLAAAHDVGLVHRDFKPANVIVGGDGRVRVLDFGLARPEGARTVGPDEHGDDDDEGGARPRRRVQGTPAYMSPEQHRGAEIDARSDLFSFCVTLFEALYGVRPFRGGNRLTAALAIVEGRMIELAAEQRASVPEWIHAVVMRGLASEPERRWPDMVALIGALERSPEQRRRRRLMIAGAIAGVVATIALIGALLPGRRGFDRCREAGEGIAVEWNADARARLHERIGARGQPLIDGLARRARSWSDASAQLCRDRRARRLTERLEAAREACLAEQRERVATLIELADDPELAAGLAARPYAAVRALGDPGRCVDASVPAEDRPSPSAAQRRARFELGLRLAVLDEPPSATLEGDPERDPELALLLGRLAVARGDREVAEDHLYRVAASMTGVEPTLAAQAWLALVELEVAALERGEAGTQALARERARGLIAYADALLGPGDLAARGQLGLLAGRLALLERSDRVPVLVDAAIDSLEGAGDELDLRAALLELRAELLASARGR